MRKDRETARVRIFMDYWNFARNWQRATAHFPNENLDWGEFPKSILEHLDEIPHIRNSRKDLRAVKIYASVAPLNVEGQDLEAHEINEEQRLQSWLQNDLDQLAAYTVDITIRSNKPLRCDLCSHNNSQFVEQGVDTKIAIDLVALASRDLYDIAVLITDDGDLVPSTQCVQDTIDKQIVHLGFKGQKTDVRNEAWGHLFVDDMFATILK